MKRSLFYFRYWWYWLRSRFAPRKCVETNSRLREPLKYECGSEEELVRVTTWICHAYPQIFQLHSSRAILYRAKYGHTNAASGELLLPRGTPTGSQHSEPCWKLIHRLCTLAYQWNTFIGNAFVDYVPVPHPSASRFHYEYLEYECLGTQSLLFIEVQPPSAHECAEALLSLSEWLDGKVSKQEKRELLQLANPVSGG